MDDLVADIAKAVIDAGLRGSAGMLLFLSDGQVREIVTKCIKAATSKGCPLCGRKRRKDDD